MEETKILKPISSERVAAIKRKLANEGADKFEYDNVSITLLKALLAENDLIWDGYFILSSGESAENGFCTKNKPAIIKLTTKSNPNAQSFLLRVDTETLQLKLNDGHKNPMFASGSDAWLKTQAKVYGKEFINGLKEVWTDKYNEAKQQMYAAKHKLENLELIAKNQLYM